MVVLQNFTESSIASKQQGTGAIKLSLHEVLMPFWHSHTIVTSIEIDRRLGFVITADPVTVAIVFVPFQDIGFTVKLTPEIDESDIVQGKLFPVRFRIVALKV